MNLLLEDFLTVGDGNGGYGFGEDGHGNLYLNYNNQNQVLFPIGILFADSLSLNDLLILQPLIPLSDGFSFNDGFNLQLGSLLLLFDSDFFLIDDLAIQETITSLLLNDLYGINDSFTSSQQNGPSFNDSFSLGDGITGISSGCFLVLGDNIDNFNDSLAYSEGYVTTSETFNDSLMIQDGFFIVLPNVTLQVTLNDSFSFLDSMSTGNVEMLNTYLRRYLNDVIPN